MYPSFQNLSWNVTQWSSLALVFCLEICSDAFHSFLVSKDYFVYHVWYNKMALLLGEKLTIDGLLQAFEGAPFDLDRDAMG
jgi:hypothetical protein